MARRGTRNMCGIDGTLFPGQEKAGTALRFKFIGVQFPKVALTGNLGLEGATVLRFDLMMFQFPKVAVSGNPGLEVKTPLVLKSREQASPYPTLLLPRGGSALQPKVARQGYLGNAGEAVFEPQRGSAKFWTYAASAITSTSANGKSASIPNALFRVSLARVAAVWQKVYPSSSISKQDPQNLRSPASAAHSPPSSSPPPP